MTPSAGTVGGLVLDIAGALMLALGLVFKKSETALDEATPKYNFNAALDASLAAQTADAQVGALTLSSGFGVQMVAALGWHETSWCATGIAFGAGVAAAAAAWVFLDRVWRPRKIKQALFARLRAIDDVGTWGPALAAFGDILKRPPQGENEIVAAYAIRLFGAKRWALLTAGVDAAILVMYTHPRSEIRGTPEYEEAHLGRSSDESAAD